MRRDTWINNASMDIWSAYVSLVSNNDLQFNLGNMWDQINLSFVLTENCVVYRKYI